MKAKQRERLEMRLLELLYDELPPEEAEAVRREVAEHPELQARLNEWEGVRRAVASLPEIEAEPQLGYAVLRAARKAADERPSGWWAWFAGIGMAPAMTGAAVVMLALAGALTLTRGVEDRAPEATAGPTRLS